MVAWSCKRLSRESPLLASYEIGRPQTVKSSVPVGAT